MRPVAASLAVLWITACATPQSCPACPEPAAESAGAEATENEGAGAEAAEPAAMEEKESAPAAAAQTPAEEVRALADAPRKQVAEGKAQAVLLARGHNAFVGRLELAPGFAVPEHQDPTEEYIHVLEGHGTLTMNGKAYEIQPGTTIFMPAGATVSYQNGDAKMVAVQVFAGPGPAAKYDGWQAVSETATEAQ